MRARAQNPTMHLLRPVLPDRAVVRRRSPLELFMLLSPHRAQRSRRDSFFQPTVRLLSKLLRRLRWNCYARNWLENRLGVCHRTDSPWRTCVPSGVLTRFVFSAKGAVSLQPGASPQEFKLASKQALKVRFKLRRSIELVPAMNCAFSAGFCGL